MSWENEDDSSTDSDDDEVANICLMANDEKVSGGAKILNLDNRCSKHMTNDQVEVIESSHKVNHMNFQRNDI
ncbi:hypothetical protein PIB30_086513 [Stylosanthes scabra]|uniref:Uncharacterized protein n=1 Tax=Stylosanthes scabra TaxID=79078 RepID=A0ABU6USJ9_9FABA|nr:hypothetical protein [Stylosanthes scabra]